MANEFETVAGEMFPTEQSADDAQTAVTAEELMQDLTGEESDEPTAENEGDGARHGQKAAGQETQSKDDRFTRRMKAALASQKRQLYADLGGSEEEIREILRAHRAQKLTQENPKISPEAAKIIIEEREKTAQPGTAQNAEIVSALNGLIEDGWTREMLTAFVQDETVREQINDEGMSVRKAATAYLMRANRPQTSKKSVPTLRTATAAGTQDVNRIEDMTDEQFDAFARRARSAMENGRKVRL